MAATLYTLDILRLATQIAAFARLDAPHATASKRAPLCGSRVDVDVRLDGAGRIEALGLQVSACALGQASAALMALSARGKSCAELEAARDSLKAWLEGQSDKPGEWPNLAVFTAARAHSARHGAIMLGFEAAAEAARLAQMQHETI